jgi:hypothetical protein
MRKQGIAEAVKVRNRIFTTLAGEIMQGIGQSPGFRVQTIMTGGCYNREAP